MMNELKTFVENGCPVSTAGDACVYPESVFPVGEGCIFMCDSGDCDHIVAIDVPGFTGEELSLGGRKAVIAPLDHANAEALRRALPFTAPSSVLKSQRSIGLGDRLGIATDGHIRALKSYDACPVFAQQSIRELTLTSRSFSDVIDCASFAALRNGYTKPFGADGDHLKTPAEVQMAIDCGCTMITLDCSEFIRGEAAEKGEAELRECVALPEGLEERYLGRSFCVEGYEITYTAEEVLRCQAIYGEAISFAARIFREFIDGSDLDFELSIDETASPTTPAQHYFISNELALLGVKTDTVAPRFCGEFQKGIDYIGDVEQYEAEYAVHAAIARKFGYKISIHSGSDKFSVFPVSGKLSQGVFHVKTAGTNWLEAMRVVAQCDPKLYREVHAFALEHFAEATKYYHVTTDLDRIPALESLCDSELPGLFEMNDARQLIHITYGLILSAKSENGEELFKTRLYSLWRSHREEYALALERHISKHLQLLYSEIG